MIKDGTSSEYQLGKSQMTLSLRKALIINICFTCKFEPDNKGEAIQRETIFSNTE